MLHGEKEKGAAWDGSHEGLPGCRPAREPGSRRQRGLTEKHGRGLGYLPAVKLPTKLTLPGTKCHAGERARRNAEEGTRHVVV